MLTPHEIAFKKISKCIDNWKVHISTVKTGWYGKYIFQRLKLVDIISTYFNG